MRNQRKQIKMSIFLVVVALLVALIVPVAAQEEEPPTCGHPIVGRLVNVMDVECQVLLDRLAEGAGFGQVMRAWHLSQTLPGYEGTWENLLQAHGEGQGWGEVMFAHRFAASLGEGSNLTPDELLRLKQEEGLGWGQIRQVQAIAEAGLASFDDATGWIAAGMEWEEIREQLGLEEGPPPWAGPPSWAAAFGGPPSWAGGPPPWAGGAHGEGDGDQEGNAGPPGFVDPPGRGNGGPPDSGDDGD